MPPYHRMGGSLLCLCHFFMYGNGFLNRGFTDRREILHGGSATPSNRKPVHSSFLGIAPRMAEFWASTGGGMAGYASCWSTCLNMSVAGVLKCCVRCRSRCCSVFMLLKRRTDENKPTSQTSMTKHLRHNISAELYDARLQKPRCKKVFLGFSVFRFLKFLVRKPKTQKHIKTSNTYLTKDKSPVSEG